MNELLQAWTRAGNAVAAHFEKLNGGVALAPAPVPAAEEPARTRKPRAAKPEAAVPSAASAPGADFSAGLGIQGDAPVPPAAAADPALDEKKSLDEMYKLAMEFVNKDAVAANVAARQAKAKAHYGSVYKVGNIKDLPHTQRLQFIAWLREQISSPAAV